MVIDNTFQSGNCCNGKIMEEVYRYLISQQQKINNVNKNLQKIKINKNPCNVWASKVVKDIEEVFKTSRAYSLRHKASKLI